MGKKLQGAFSARSLKKGRINMKKQKKQSLLTAIIVILVIALIMMIGSIVYEEKINMNKQQAQNTVETFQKEENDIEEEKKDEPIEQ